MRKTVVLADDYPIVRQGMRTLLEDAGLEIVGEAADGLEAVAQVETLQPDVLVLELSLPGLNGLDVLPIVRARSAGTRVVVLTRLSGHEPLARALRLGASGYVLKSCGLPALLEAVTRVAAGRTYVSPSLRNRPGLDPKSQDAQDPHDRLTPRERQVLQLVVEGRTNAQAAAALQISRRTVEMHRAHLMRKLSLRTPADLLRYAFQRGMFPIRNN